MIYQILKKHKHVMEYDEKVEIIKKSDVVDLLNQTWDITPSKNNLMPWQVFVLGPDNQNYKNAVYDVSSKNEDRENEKNENIDMDKIIGRNPAYAHIKSCQYLLIMTQRLSGPLNEFQQKQWDNGVYWDTCTEEGLIDNENIIAIECGIFSANFRALAIEKGIDTSYTLNFNNDLKYWKEFPFINRQPVLLMTMGYGKKYRKDIIFNDPKPNFETIVKFV